MIWPSVLTGVRASQIPRPKWRLCNLFLGLVDQILTGSHPLTNTVALSLFVHARHLPDRLFVFHHRAQRSELLTQVLHLSSRKKLACRHFATI